MRFSFAMLCAAFLFGAPAHASYRVYQLKVEHFDAFGKLERTQHVLSILDQVQYEHYYGGYRWDKVTLEDTWYCPGDTSNFRPYCKKPKVKPRTPASLERGKRVELPYTRQPVIP